MKHLFMKATNSDSKFDSGKENVVDALDLSKLNRQGLKPRRVNVDFPEWMVKSLDKEACRLGITRQSLIKLWVADKLDHSSL